ncbi:MAG: electron transport complex subunit RsxC [Lachnospiraceae bacterium]|nr:electron transport complex subunit RsxC [Lachnospiraceae bacterium]
MRFSKRGAHVPHHKNTADMTPIRMDVPSQLLIPVSMHIGRPATPVVKPGDHVDVGTLICESSGPVSSPIYSAVSGTVKKLDNIRVSNGSFCQAVLIESDGQQTVDANIKPPVVTDYASFIEAVKNSGIVGLGGAGFPTAVKLDVKDTSRIQELVINAAECEPYITSDTRTMIDDAQDVVDAVKLFEQYLNVKKVLIGIEANKPEAIKKMQECFKDDSAVTVVTLPSVYPQGAEKVIIKNTTGKVVPAGKLPIDVGCVVCNVTTMASIARYIKTGMPLVEKYVTIDGSAIKKPGNYIIPVGMLISEIMERLEINPDEVGKVLYGGPMMGISVPELDSAPVLKNTNAITFMSEKDAVSPEATQCIHCGRCAENCPMHLTTFAIARAYAKNDAEELRRLRVDICCECGTCSFVCPANRPLVEVNKLSKGVVRDLIAKEKAKEAEKK